MASPHKRSTRRQPQRPPHGTKKRNPVTPGARTGPAEDLLRQHEYVTAMKGRPYDLTLVVAKAFITGMRQLGYTEPQRALDELIDNGIQAGATHVHVAARYVDKVLSDLAIIDDGHGMEPDMLPLAVSWGGSHRAFFNDRSGLGRFGFGLPTACVSLCTNYTLISRRLCDEGFFSVTLDLNELAAGKYQRDGRNVAPAAAPYELSPWIRDLIAKKFGDFKQGTIVLLRQIDRVTWKESALESKLLEHFGVIYRHLIRSTRITVNDSTADSIDPLFIMPHARYYALDGDPDRAKPEGDLSIPVLGADGLVLGDLSVRFSYIPPSFPLVDKKQLKGAHNERWHILKDYNEGIVVTRNKRHIDVVPLPKDIRTSIHRDYFWGVEIDFPATLDEAFDIGTTKSRVSLSDRIWTILKNHRVPEMITELHSRGIKEREARRDALRADTTVPERAVTAAVGQHRFGGQPASKQPAAEAAYQQAVRDLAIAKELTETEAQKQVDSDIKRRPNAILWEDGERAPFYRAEWVRGQCRVHLNRQHPLFADIFSETIAPAVLRNRLEALVLIIGLAEATTPDSEMQKLYQVEVSTWDMLLKTAARNIDEILDTASLRRSETEAT